MFKEISISNIQLADSKESAGVLLTNEKSKNLIICAHGLAGNSANYINLKTRDYVLENSLDFDVFRFDFYNFTESHRTFLETTLASQISDLEHIIKHFKDLYDNIYVISTSYGALTTATLNSSLVTKQILVDPSWIIDSQWQYAKNKVLDDSHIINMDTHVPMLINPQMETEGLNWSAVKSQNIINDISIPTLLIQADSIYTQMSQALSFNNSNIEINCIETANHSFTNFNSCKLMLDQTFSFIQ